MVWRNRLRSELQPANKKLLTGGLDPVAQQTTTIRKRAEIQSLSEHLQFTGRLDPVAQQTTTIHKRTESQTLSEFLQFTGRLDPAPQQTSTVHKRTEINLKALSGFTWVYIRFTCNK